MAVLHLVPGDHVHNDESPLQDIEHEYLTFETPIPSLIYTIPHSNKPLHEDPPQQPDLTPYTNPTTWSQTRKSTLLTLSCTATFLSAYSIGAYSPAETQMMHEWHVSKTEIELGITTFAIGFGLSPMFLAPFSEIVGRRPVFIVSGATWLIFEICCAVSRVFWGELVARFLSGCMAATFSTMVGGVVADIYEGGERNTGMTVFTGAAFVGTAGGPLVAGFIAQRVDWRWIFWSHIIALGVVIVFLILFFRETRGNVLLSRRASAINGYLDAAEEKGWYQRGGRTRFKVAADEERASLSTLIRISVSRPFGFLVMEPIVTSFSLFVSFAWAVFFLTFSGIPYVFETTYGFDLEESTAPFAAGVVASVLFTFLCVYQESFGEKRGWMPLGPEKRLFFCSHQALLLPLGMFWFGWTGNYESVHWIVPTLAIAPIICGIFSIYLASFTYLADAYGPYASSAIAAQSFCRSMLAGAFPLFVIPMYEKLGIAGASSLLGGLGLVLTGIPWVLLIYGPRIRSKSKVCVRMMGEK